MITLPILKPALNQSIHAILLLHFIIIHFLVHLQASGLFQVTMNVSAVLLALVVGLIGVHTSNASSQSISPSSFVVGNRAVVVYTAPPTGRVSVNLYDEGNVDNLLHVDYRVNWGKDKNTIVLNTRTGKKWGKEVRITGITTTPGTNVGIVILLIKIPS